MYRKSRELLNLNSFGEVIRAVLSLLRLLQDGVQKCTMLITCSGELQALLSDLQWLILTMAKQESKIRMDADFLDVMSSIYNLLNRVHTDVIKKTLAKDCILHLPTLQAAAQRHIIDITTSNTSLKDYLHQHHIIISPPSPTTSTSPWRLPHISVDAISSSLWPIIVLPDRLPNFIPRKVTSTIAKSLAPNIKPHFATITTSGSVGSTEVLIETAYLLLKSGDFAVVAYVDCSSTVNVMAALLEVQQKFLTADPSTLPCLSTSLPELASYVLDWIYAHQVPYLLIFDHVSDMNLVLPLLPKTGPGQSVFLTHDSTLRHHLTRLLQEDVEQITIEHLLSEDIGGSASEGATMASLMRYFSNTVDACYAFTSLHLLSSLSHYTTSAVDFISYIDKYELPGHETVEISSSVPAAVISRRYKSFLYHISTVRDMPNTNEATISRVLHLLSTVSTTSSSLLYEWLARVPPAVSIIKSMNDVEYLVQISSMLPLPSQRTGELHYTWLLTRSKENIVAVLRYLSKICSSSFQHAVQQLNWSSPMIQNQLNMIFGMLDNESAWKGALASKEIADFLYVDSSKVVQHDIMLFVLQPLVTANLLRVMRRSAHGEVTVMMHKAMQQCVRIYLKTDDKMKEVISFVQETCKSSAAVMSSDTSALSVLPLALNVIERHISDGVLQLCEYLLPVLLQMCNYIDAEMVCKRYLTIASGTNLKVWRINLARCSLLNKKYKQAVDILHNLLDNQFHLELSTMYCEALLKLHQVDCMETYLHDKIKGTSANDFMDVRVLLASLYMKCEQWQKCLNICDDVLSSHPSQLQLLMYKAQCLVRLDHIDDAIVCLLYYIRCMEENYGGIYHPDLPPIYVLLAQCYEQKAMFNEAEAHLALAVDISEKCSLPSSDHIEFLYLYVSALLHVGNFDTALSTITVAIGIATGHSLVCCKLLCLKSRVLLLMGNFSDAEQVVNDAMKICESNVKSDMIVAVLNTKADISKSRNNSVAALVYSSQALDFLLQYERATNEQKWQQFERCGDLAAEQHRNEDAKQYYDKCLDLRSNERSEDVHTAEILEKVANLLEEKGERMSAEQYRRQADDIYSKHSSYIASTPAVTVEHHDECNYLQSHALELLMKKHGSNHPRIATALQNLAGLLLSRGRFADALPLRQKQLYILRHVYGEFHPAVVTALYNVGYVFYCLHQWEDAIECLTDTLTKQKQLYSYHHELVAQSYAILGYVYFHTHRYEQSKNAWEECVAIRSQILTEQHEATLLAMNNLGMVLKKLMKYREAEGWLRKSLELRNELFGESDATGVAYYSLGLLLLSMGRLVEASEMLHKALVIRKLISDSSNDVANTMQALAEVSLAQHRYGEAKSLLSEAVRVRCLLFGESHDISVATMQQLLSLLRASNATAEAASLATRLPNQNCSFDMSTLLDVLEETCKHRVVGKKTAAPLQSAGDIGIDGGPGWQNRLIAVIKNKITKLSHQIIDLEKNYNATTIMAAERDDKLQVLSQDLADKDIKILELEALMKEDKRYRYQLEMTMNEREALQKQIGEVSQHYSELLKGDLDHQENAEISNRQNEIKLLEKDAFVIEEVYSRECELQQFIADVDAKICQQISRLEMLQFESKEADEEEVEAQVAAIFTVKRDLEVKRELLKLQLRRVSSELDAIKLKYNVTTVSVVPAPALMKPVRVVEESESESSGDESDDDADSGKDASESATGLKKKIRKQKLLIKLLRSQISTLGAEPIEEVVSYERAESKLQSALTRLMEGDESASDEFTKWDNFIRNHPEHKRREEERKLAWERQNTALNEACLRRIRSIVPACIVSTATLAQLESQLPPAVAKRVWTKKALWLTRLSVARIGKLHVADFQSKYSTQGLDEVELRAIWATLPPKFENDERGGKANWKDGIYNGIMAKAKVLPWGDMEPSSEGIEEYLNTVDVAVPYRYIHMRLYGETIFYVL